MDASTVPGAGEVPEEILNGPYGFPDSSAPGFHDQGGSGARHSADQTDDAAGIGHPVAEVEEDPGMKSLGESHQLGGGGGGVPDPNRR